MIVASVCIFIISFRMLLSGRPNECNFF